MNIICCIVAHTVELSFQLPFPELGLSGCALLTATLQADPGLNGSGGGRELGAQVVQTEVQSGTQRHKQGL